MPRSKPRNDQLRWTSRRGIPALAGETSGQEVMLVSAETTANAYAHASIGHFARTRLACSRIETREHCPRLHGCRVTVYDIKDADGRVFAFEVDNLTLGTRCLQGTGANSWLSPRERTKVPVVVSRKRILPIRDRRCNVRRRGAIWRQQQILDRAVPTSMGFANRSSTPGLHRQARHLALGPWRGSRVADRDALRDC